MTQEKKTLHQKEKQQGNGNTRIKGLEVEAACQWLHHTPLARYKQAHACIMHGCTCMAWHKQSHK